MYANIKTEYSFKRALGQIGEVVERLRAVGATRAGISDYNNSYGHYAWQRLCKDAGIKPCFGVTLPVVEDASLDKPQVVNLMPLMAMNNHGLAEMYALIRRAYAQYYKIPRLSYDDINSISQDVAVFSGAWLDEELIKRDVYSQLTPSSPSFIEGERFALLDNFYPALEDHQLWAAFADNTYLSSNIHILTESEYINLFLVSGQAAINNTNKLMNECTAQLGKSPMVSYSFPTIIDHSGETKAADLRELCYKNVRGVKLKGEYKARVERELSIIEEKGFGDYFLIVADLVNYAKQNILVGPARGSSAGSLVCYLIGITEVDPLEHDLIFERFIDITRDDWPDIDIDFPDYQRDQAIQYLLDKYGADNVAKLSTISKMQPRVIINDSAKKFQIPLYECDELKNVIIERMKGDDRANQCLEDTYETDEGQRFLEKYPEMSIVSRLEGHARHAGVHAAGVLVSPKPLVNYCGIDGRDNVAMLDKFEAEGQAGLLKIDILGLRTLSIISDCLTAIGHGRLWLYALPLDDGKAFTLFNSGKFNGIFQFEGFALRALSAKMDINTFNDIVAVTSLARPGPLASGGAELYADRKMKRAAYFTSDVNPILLDITSDTHGIIVYQEQVIRIIREIGLFDWPNTSKIRKAISKSMGNEFFSQYKRMFIDGAMRNDFTESEATELWQNLLTFGAWGFNKSHAVSYGMISYYCAYLKANHPGQYITACLNHAKSDEDGLRLLREYTGEYVAADPAQSGDRWIEKDGTIYGPLTNIKGIGDKVCADIIRRRTSGAGLTDAQARRIKEGENVYKNAWPCRDRFSDYYANPAKYNVLSCAISYIEDVRDNQSYVFLGQLTEAVIKNHNDPVNVERRGGTIMQGKVNYLNLTIEDDTGLMLCTILRNDFDRFSQVISKEKNQFYLIKGSFDSKFNKVNIDNIRHIT